MPVMDGFEAAAEIRRREQETGKHIPVIALIADAIEGDRETCLASGFDDFVSKPIQWKVLIAVIDRLGPA